MKLKDVTKSLSLIFSVSSYDLIKSDNKYNFFWVLVSVEEEILFNSFVIS